MLEEPLRRANLADTIRSQAGLIQGGRREIPKDLIS